MTPKQIRFGSRSRGAALAGIDSLADAVAITLGPRGRNVLLERARDAPVVTRDGFTVARDIEPEDRFERLGATLLKEITSRAYDVAGDGTTTATVLARAIVAEGARLTATGLDAMALRRGVEKAVGAVIRALADLSREVAPSELAAVATIAAGNDVDLGQIVARAFARIGRDGVVSVETDRGLDTRLEFVEGLQLDRGMTSPVFVTDPSRMEARHDDCLVLVHERRIATIREIVPVLEAASVARKPLLVVAEKIEGEALQTLLANHARGAVRCVAVESPAYSGHRRDLLADLATVTGGRVVSAELGNTAAIRPDDLGRAKQVIVGRSETTVIGGGGSRAAIESRARAIRKLVAETASELDRGELELRLASLLGGVAIVRVGGATECDVRERKARFEGAVCAARAALQEGVVPGGGVALVRAARALDSLDLPDDELPAIRIVRRALEEPTRRIAENAGYDPSVVVERVRAGNGSDGFGFNAATGRYEDLVAAGIVDSTKAVRIALQTAASIAGLVMTTEAAVVASPWAPVKNRLDPPTPTGGLRPRSGRMK